MPAAWCVDALYEIHANDHEPSCYRFHFTQIKTEYDIFVWCVCCCAIKTSEWIRTYYPIDQPPLHSVGPHTQPNLFFILILVLQIDIGTFSKFSTKSSQRRLLPPTQYRYRCSESTTRAGWLNLIERNTCLVVVVATDLNPILTDIFYGLAEIVLFCTYFISADAKPCVRESYTNRGSSFVNFRPCILHCRLYVSRYSFFHILVHEKKIEPDRRMTFDWNRELCAKFNFFFPQWSRAMQSNMCADFFPPFIPSKKNEEKVLI